MSTKNKHNNKAIQLLRTEKITSDNKNVELIPGQPFYNSQKNYLTIGKLDGAGKINDSPIACRSLIGYIGDSNSEIKENDAVAYKVVEGDEAGDLDVYAVGDLSIYSGAKLQLFSFSDTDINSTQNMSLNSGSSICLQQGGSDKISINKSDDGKICHYVESVFEEKITGKKGIFISEGGASIEGAATINGNTEIIGTLKATEKITGSKGLEIESDGITVSGGAKIKGITTIDGPTTIKQGAAITGGNTTITYSSSGTSKFKLTDNGITVEGNSINLKGNNSAISSSNSIDIGSIGTIGSIKIHNSNNEGYLQISDTTNTVSVGKNLNVVNEIKGNSIKIKGNETNLNDYNFWVDDNNTYSLTGIKSEITSSNKEVANAKDLYNLMQYYSTPSVIIECTVESGDSFSFDTTDSHYYVDWDDGTSTSSIKTHDFLGSGTFKIKFFGITSLYNLDISQLSNVKISLKKDIEEIPSNFILMGASNLASITIGNSVTSISSNAFSGCSSLMDIIIPDSVTSIGKGAFSGCSSLVNITLPFVGNSKDGTSDTHFGYIFGASETNTQSNQVPSSLRTVIITSAKKLNDYAFEGCKNISSFELPDNIDIGRHSLRLDKTSYADARFTIYDNAYYIGTKSNPYYYLVKAKNTSIANVTIHEKCKYIGETAFKNCEQLSYVNITNSQVEIIGDSAFCGCKLLNSIELPISLKEIRKAAFYNCNNIEYIYIPDNVEIIEEQAFYHTLSTSFKVILNRNIKRLDAQAFYNTLSSSYNTIIYYRGNRTNLAHIIKGGFVPGNSQYDWFDILYCYSDSFKKYRYSTQYDGTTPTNRNTNSGCWNWINGTPTLIEKDPDDGILWTENGDTGANVNYVELGIYKIIFKESDSSSTILKLRFTDLDGTLHAFPNPNNGKGWYLPNGAIVDTFYRFSEKDITVVGNKGSNTIVLYSNSTGTGGGTGGDGGGDDNSGGDGGGTGGGTTNGPFTITLNPNGGTVNQTSVKTNQDGTLSSDLPTPTRNNYTFLGWYTASSGGTKITTGHIFNSNTTIYAQWQENTSVTNEVTVNFLLTDAAGNVTNSNYHSTTTQEGKIPTNNWPTEPTLEGHIFNGWYYNNATRVNETTYFPTFEVDPARVYSQWTEEPEEEPDEDTPPYTITFDSNGGTWVDGDDSTTKTTKTNENGILSEIPDVQYEGRRLVGWKDENGAIFTENDLPIAFTGNATLQAQWSVQCQVTYKYALGNGSSGSSEPENVDTDSNYTLKSFEEVFPSVVDLTGYEFTGWEVEGKFYPSDSSNKEITVLKDTIIIAVFEIMVTYYRDDTKENVYTDNVVEGSNYTIKSLNDVGFAEKEKARFVNWKVEGSDTYYKSGDTIEALTESLILIAQWKEEATLHAYSNGGYWEGLTSDAKDVYTGYEDDTVDLSTIEKPTRDGYAFNGWSTEANGSSTTSSITLTEGDNYIYAQWDNMHTINYYYYNKDNIKTLYESYDINPGSTHEMPSNVTLNGSDSAIEQWVDNKGNTYKQSITPTGDLDLYAQYKVNTKYREGTNEDGSGKYYTTNGKYTTYEGKLESLFSSVTRQNFDILDTDWATKEDDSLVKVDTDTIFYENTTCVPDCYTKYVIYYNNGTNNKKIAEQILKLSEADLYENNNGYTEYLLSSSVEDSDGNTIGRFCYDDPETTDDDNDPTTTEGDDSVVGIAGSKIRICVRGDINKYIPIYGSYEITFKWEENEEEKTSKFHTNKLGSLYSNSSLNDPTSSENKAFKGWQIEDNATEDVLSFDHIKNNMTFTHATTFIAVWEDKYILKYMDARGKNNINDATLLSTSEPLTSMTKLTKHTHDGKDINYWNFNDNICENGDTITLESGNNYAYAVNKITFDNGTESSE